MGRALPDVEEEQDFGELNGLTGCVVLLQSFLDGLDVLDEAELRLRLRGPRGGIDRWEWDIYLYRLGPAFFGSLLSFRGQQFDLIFLCGFPFSACVFKPR